MIKKINEKNANKKEIKKNIEKTTKDNNKEENSKEEEIFKIIENEFQISIENKKKSEAAKKISEVMHEYAELLEEKIQGDSSLINAIESNSFNEEEREKYFFLLKKLMILKTKYDIVKLSNENFDGLIKEYLTEWALIKKELLKFFEKIKSNWEQNETEKNLRLNYLG